MQFVNALKTAQNAIKDITSNEVDALRQVCGGIIRSVSGIDVLNMAIECKVTNRVRLDGYITTLFNIAIEKNVDLDLGSFDSSMKDQFDVTKKFIHLMKASGNQNINIDATLNSIVLKKDDSDEKVIEKINSLFNQFASNDVQGLFDNLRVDIVEKLFPKPIQPVQSVQPPKKLVWADCEDESDDETDMKQLKPKAPVTTGSLPSGFSFVEQKSKVSYGNVAQKAASIIKNPNDGFIKIEKKKKIVQYEWLDSICEHDPNPKKFMSSAARLVIPSKKINGLNPEKDLFSHVVFDTCMLLDEVNEAPIPIGWKKLGEMCEDEKARYWSYRPTYQYKYAFQLDREIGVWSVVGLSNPDIDVKTGNNGEIIIEKGMTFMTGDQFISNTLKPRVYN
jgi:hypothetical protein